MYQFSEPCLESAFRLDESELESTDQVLARQGDREVLVFETRLVEAGKWCSSCGCAGRPRGSRRRLLTHCPNGTRPAGCSIASIVHDTSLGPAFQGSFGDIVPFGAL